jgi:Derlin-2/3
MYIESRYSYYIETGPFRNRPADYILFIVFGCCNFLLAAFAFGLEFMADGMSFMTLYYWSRKIPNMDVNFMDIFIFRSCFMAYFYLILTTLCGFSVVNQLMGIAIGHLYFFLDDVVPRINDTQDVRVLKAPGFLVQLCRWFRLD